MNRKQIFAIKFLEDAINDIQNDYNLSAQDNVRVALVYINDVINVTNLGRINDTKLY